MKVYLYLVKGHRLITYVMVKANDNNDAQTKAVRTFNTVMNDIAVKIYEV